MTNHEVKAQTHLDKLYEMVDREAFASVLVNARNQLYCQHVLGYPASRQPKTEYEIALHHAKCYMEANHLNIIETADYEDLRFLETEWGWWYLPGQEERIKETRTRWKKQHGAQ